MSKFTSERAANISAVRAIMAKEGIQAFLVPTDDPHMSEYVAPYFARREFISGFTGSAGTVLITTDAALLFTDGRYHNQAELELDADWALMRVGLKDIPTVQDYLVQSLKERSVLGIDPLVHSADAVKKLETTLAPNKVTVKLLTSNPIDSVWKLRPPKPSALIRQQPLEYAGKSMTEKLKEIKVKLAQEKADALVVTALDQIAWLLNIRGSDIPCNPVAISYAIVEIDAAKGMFTGVCFFSTSLQQLQQYKCSS